MRAKIRLSCLKLLVDHKNPPESLQNCRIWKDLRNPADDYIAKCTIFRFAYITQISPLRQRLDVLQHGQ